MRDPRRVSGQRLPPSLARIRDFDVFADVRSLEMLRQALRREIQVHTSLRALAHDIGVDRGTLRKFLAMESVPRAENLEKIRDWAADRPDLWIPLGTVALALLVNDLPAPLRAPVRRQVAGELADAYTREERRVPEWLARECGG